MAVQPTPEEKPSSWTRRYPPLILLALSVLVAGIILPSSLNIPNSNPSTVLEYAPVPPEDDSPTPPEGNVSSLGLGSSSSLSSGGIPPPPPPADRGVGSRPQTKRCVGNPPRQTEDPMSPPCVPFFDGENFGSTYQGVTGDEITVLLYYDVGAYSNESSPAAGTYVDLDSAAKPPCPETWPATNPDRDRCDSAVIRVSRALAKYFNDRYQTYNRRVHFWAYFSSADTAAARRSEAQDNWTRLRPFAVVNQTFFNGNAPAYNAAMAGRGVLSFSSLDLLPNEIYRQSAPLMWSFWPDIEHWADSYASYVCTKVAGKKALHTGNPQGTGLYFNRDRKFGLFYTTDPNHPELHVFREAVKDRLRRCGVTWAAEGTYPESGFVTNNRDTGTDQRQAVLKFQQNEVTTVLYLGGIEGKFSEVAAEAQYYPEIVLAGDRDLDGNGNGRRQNKLVWQNAWGTQMQLRIDRLEDTPGYRAFKEGDPNGLRKDGPWARDFYWDFFMLYQGIQVAGPRLTPETVDQGFHAIPPHQSTNPYVASCFFDPGDYSCIKDAHEVWWDNTGTSPGSTDPGCMRIVRGGQRYLSGRWGNEDLVFRDTSQPCTAYGGGVGTRLA